MATGLETGRFFGGAVRHSPRMVQTGQRLISCSHFGGAEGASEKVVADCRIIGAGHQPLGEQGGNELNRTVAIKTLPDELASNEQRLRRFIQEAKAASALDHPHPKSKV